MTDIGKLKMAVEGALLHDDLPTQEVIRERVDEYRRYIRVTDEEALGLIREFEAVHGVSMSEGAALQETGFKPWLEDERSRWEPYYWERYRKLLLKRGFSGRVLSTMDSVTDRILGFLENPAKQGIWDRRGMVMGHVQSGKTANYTGMICKAADAGYRVIVIVAGIHNNLRDQTQRRIDEGLVGIDSTGHVGSALPRHTVVGVGHIDSQRRPNVFTTSLRDFNKATADGVGIPLRNLTEPAVFVIKKNVSTLRNLIEWLTAHNARHGTETVVEPMLLIDDEADNASINIRFRQDEVSRINGQIRQLLALFDRSCYIGYTATPFANIFIDPHSDDTMLGDDLFPRDFIVSLDPPSNYFGATRVFVDDAELIVHDIHDNADVLPLTHQIDHQVTDLPETLETAVRVFVVARAIRLAREQVGQHNSMLVNVSRFVGVQRQVRQEIHELVDRIRRSVRVNGAKPPALAAADPEIAALQKAFEMHYSSSCGLSWPDVQGHLHESAGAVRVVEVNSSSADSLDYAEHKVSGLNVIAVGGFSLSRGLTLEGLVVSYFLRNSMMYDTLLQMGRWFGYRPGYDDLCRVWMPEEAQGWYTHIADSIEELREDLARMQQLNATPREFGLRVRSHPDTLIVTARNKMGTGSNLRLSIGLANHFVETAILRADPGSLEANRRAAATFARKLRSAGYPPERGEQVNGGRLVRRVPVQLVDAFLAAFLNHEGSPLTATEPIRLYIEKRQADELREWDVLFAGVMRERAPAGALVDESLGFPLVCQRRAKGERSQKGIMLMVTNKQRVSSRGIERIGVDDNLARLVEEKYDATMSPSNTRTNYPDRIYRPVRTRALLVIHLLAIGKDGDNLVGKKPVVAWSISFPATTRTEDEDKVEYVVNTTWEQEHYPEYGDEDDDGE